MHSESIENQQNYPKIVKQKLLQTNEEKKVNLSTNKCNINAKLSNKSANIMKLIKSDLPTLTRTKTYH